ncbi:SOS response-associated peptidase [Lutimaribacter sp. EGI FJ00015]|uniref:SOS response-associated peptidase n=1 Tax=Lutimaribacter degradans TaxID=2945989 RepID=A0ACC5ZXV7_9RHOB|nr:SOS response-associated peptidase [Lutimaribacter sp. EGI FJ00013]MCM2562906.1 SOS response-associated peptidase [Lutimaribacter sp. EGI FJ00013]MCO0614073.1 SOS response-associated peptidase [Lutimaribacter sp. EGI FJ00015]MCO0636051.1 SOS response-associated peptidase [Lutimaribacter sp. EGI FJ00014]
MCGRFALTMPPDAMAQLFDATLANDLPDVPDYNICPTNQVLGVVSGAQGRRIGAMRWGFLPHWYKSPTDGPLLINARAETIADKPAFRSAVRKRRCLIAADGFYEWEKDSEGSRLPWFVTRSDGAPMIFAGVWQMWGPEEARLPTCAIVTTEAGPDIATIHHRQPVILDPGDWPLWLGEAGKGAAKCLRATPSGGLKAWRVDPRVNSNRASGPDLIRPLDAA